ncbi:uncharacterized protein BO95DRAFT_458621 [Aspergillus brunneoviolaceus CBS 621.78]|uniref:Uncharacterized protein n=1 Tax=Aspergillus brunneoviolaceus CBS 621.78 TaxID=1450534 RepID=A0ACD1GPQ2_9EURO|nr:hypothetical protein BO95DRAFT_458621 [Aspergillus brunneoviolaceus CBS 621.78]RAH51268.1 hypothetical protein BO95DRAFT_458621 [Aspergillus brunneoviolaceus CBS 621.78]
MRITAIIPFLALASHPLTACAHRLTGKFVLGAGPIRRDTGNQYCCVGVDGPGTAAYKYVEQYKDPSPAVGTNCRSPKSGLCDDGAPNLVSCTDSFGV